MYEFELQRPPTRSSASREFHAAAQRRPVLVSLFGAVVLGVLAGIALKPTAADHPPAERHRVRTVVSQDAWPDELSIVVDNRLPQTTPLPSMAPAPSSPAPRTAPFVEASYEPAPRPAPAPWRERPPERMSEPTELELEPAGPPDDSCVFVGPGQVACGEAAHAEYFDDDEAPPDLR